jgi:hypothetical protein
MLSHESACSRANVFVPLSQHSLKAVEPNDASISPAFCQLLKFQEYGGCCTTGSRLEGKYSDIMVVSVPQWELSGEIEEATHWLLE